MQTSAELLSANGDFVLFTAIIIGVMLVLRWFVQPGASAHRGDTGFAIR